MNLGPVSIEKCLTRYSDSHYKDQTVIRPSYLYNGNLYAGKTASLYQDNRLTVVMMSTFSALAALEVTMSSALGAASDHYVDILSYAICQLMQDMMKSGANTRHNHMHCLMIYLDKTHRNL